MNNKKLFFIATIIFLLDRLTKYLVMQNLHEGVLYTLFDGLLSFTFLKNAGAAFSLFQNQQVFLISVSALVVGFILVYFSRHKNASIFLQVSWGLLLGGALGNLFDRFYYNYVVDFICLDFVNFPVFNLADIAITFGVAFICFYVLFFESKGGLDVRKD